MKKRHFFPILFTIALVIVVCPLLWWAIWAYSAMKESAIPGHYRADGVWGKSTLELRPDHTFSQEVEFSNQYTQVDEGRKEVQGRWRCDEHRLWKNQIELDSFIELAPLDQKRITSPYRTEYEMMLFAPVIVVDPGAGIYYAK